MADNNGQCSNKSNLHCIKQILLDIHNKLLPFLSLVNCHMVDFILSNAWENKLPEKMGLELNDLPLRTLNKIVHFDEEAVTLLASLNEKYPAISEFFSSVHNLRLGKFDILSSVSQVYKCLGITEHLIENDRVRLGNLMTEQKTHEVQEMSRLVFTLCKGCRTDWVCDLGAGKGYLSSVLARHYGLNVLAIDCKETNMSAAKVYQRTLQKELNHQKKLKKSGSTSKINIKSKDNDTINKTVIDQIQNQNSVKSGRYICSTEYIGTGSSMIDLFNKNVQNHSEHLSENPNNNSSDTSENKNIQMETLSSSLKEIEKSPLMTMCGLHTCGDLSPTSMRIFATDPSVRVFAGVGCCYHCLTERFSEVATSEIVSSSRSNNSHKTENSKNPDSNEEFGFPLSKTLSSKSAYLGRNARLIANQPPARLAKGESFNEESQYWRALLQHIVIKEIYKHFHCNQELQKEDFSAFIVSKEFRDSPHFEAIRHFRIGKLASKSTDFCQYFEAAISKLPNFVRDCINVTGDELTESVAKYSHHRTLIHKFFLLRAALGPVIEELIVLDRLVYLLEQESVRCAHIIPLFDVMTSPRNYAIVSAKKIK